jgi:nucleoid DNA-binding protein
MNIDNIKPVITSSNIVSIIRNSNEYKNDLDNKVSTNSFELHKNDMNNYLSTTFSTINNNINKKASEEKVNGIDTRVKTLESNTSASNIISTVRNSSEYKNDLDKKSDKDKIISTINNSIESELISKEKIEFPTEYYLDTIYTGNNIKIKNPNKEPEELTLDTIVDNIDFETKDLEITMNIDNIKETDYVTVLDNANIYMNNNEIIKLLLYEIQQLKIRISELENNN